MTLACHKCHASLLRATGRFNESRFNHRRRAELVCEHCGHQFSSGLDEAIAMGEAVLSANGGVEPERPMPVTPPIYLDPGYQGLTPISASRDAALNDPRLRQIPEGDR